MWSRSDRYDLFSPRMWRCFSVEEIVDEFSNIFSTYVEVFLVPTVGFAFVANFLHVCGGVSHGHRTVNFVFVIFSTYVEVFLYRSCSHLLMQNFLHVCGGVSTMSQRGLTNFKFSPRMWRCFS